MAKNGVLSLRRNASILLIECRALEIKLRRQVDGAEPCERNSQRIDTLTRKFAIIHLQA